MSSTPPVGSAGQLLPTKLHAPRFRRPMVPRERLAERPAQAHHPVLTLVSAPAGFGKTTLLTEWFGTSQPTRSARAGWVALDSGDNDPMVFARYLLAALRSAVPDLGPQADDALRSGLPLQAVVAAMVTELESVDSDVTLVLDDYHTIETAEIHEALTLLVEHAPAHVRLVIAGRSDPPLPLARWRARGDLLEIRAADLRFTDAEAAAYLGDVMGLTLTPQRSARSRPGPRAGSLHSSSRRCRSRAATTWPRSSTTSPATTGSYSTTSRTRCSTVNPTICVTSCCARRCSTG